MAGNYGQCTQKRVDQIERREQILAMRLRQRMSYAQIAAAIGVSSQRIQRILKQEMARYNKERTDLAGQLVDRSIAEVDQAIKLAWSIATSPLQTDKMRLEAIDRVHKFQVHKDKLLGLGTEKIDVTSGGAALKFIAGVDEDDL